MSSCRETESTSTEDIFGSSPKTFPMHCERICYNLTSPHAKERQTSNVDPPPNGGWGEGTLGDFSALVATYDGGLCAVIDFHILASYIYTGVHSSVILDALGGGVPALI